MYYLKVKDVSTKAPKAAVWEAVEALGVEGLGALANSTFLEPPSPELLKKIQDVADRHGIGFRDLAKDIITVVRAAQMPEGLLGLILGDGSPWMSSLTISMGERWKGGVRELLRYATSGVELEFEEGKRELLVKPPSLVAKRAVKGAVEVTHVLDAISKALYGYEPTLWKWTRLKALAGDEEAKAMYRVWKLSRDRLWPPPHPLKEGKAVKYVKNGVELWIYKWDHTGIEARVFDGDKTSTLIYTWRGAGVKSGKKAEYAETFTKLGISTKHGEFTASVRELLQEAAKNGEAVSRAEYEKRKVTSTTRPLRPERKVAPTAEPLGPERKVTSTAEPLEPEWNIVEPILLFKGEEAEIWLKAVKEDGVVFEVRHARWDEPALVKIEPKKSGDWRQLRGALHASRARPIDTLRKVAEELKAAGVPSVGVFNEGVQFGSSAVDYLMLRDKRAAELWFGEVLYWDDEVRIMYKARGKDAEKYTIAVNDGGWHIYTLAFTLRKGWEGVIYTTDPEAPRRIKKALLKAAEGTPHEEEVRKWEPRLSEGAGTYRIRMGGWAREILTKNLKIDEK